MSGKKPPTSSHTCATCNKVFSKKSFLIRDTYGICMKINKKIVSSATGLFGQNQTENGTRMLCIGKLRDMCVRIKQSETTSANMFGHSITTMRETTLRTCV